MKTESLILVLFFVKKYSLAQSRNYYDQEDDTKLNFTELANKYGLKTEEYDVVTKDGYILKLFRIPSNGKPVLLQHGFQDSADVFILRANTSLAAMLADAGHDVWLGNVRGNKYSRRHLKLNPDKDKAFWDFSLQEHGYYDIAAMIDYVLDATGRSKVDYIGHSQGTTVAFILGSTRQEYNDKIGLFIALAPVVFLQNISSILKVVFKNAPILDQLMKWVNKEELFGPNSVEQKLVRECVDPVVGYLCLNLAIFPFTGHDPAELEPSFAPVIFSHFPSGSSRKNVNHFAQIGRSGRFASYDYESNNFLHYGSKYPPLYDLKKVTMPTVLIVSKNDGFSSIVDTDRLKDILPNVVEYLIIKRQLFNHIDFVFGKNTYLMLYPKILKLLQQY